MADLNTKKINFTASQVEKAINFALTQVAEPFSTSSTYAVDDFVVYDGFLYQCISAVITAGAWDATKWQVQKIFDNNGYVIINGGIAPELPVITYNITCNLTNVVADSSNPTTITSTGTATLNFKKNTTCTYAFPESITVVGAEYTWDDIKGVIVLSNATSNVSITINATDLNYLCLTAKSSSMIRLLKAGTPTLNQNFKYSFDRSTWEELVVGVTITLENIGDKVYFRGDNSNGVNETSGIYYYFRVLDGSVGCSGNIMSLVDNGACNSLVIPNNYCFNKLFYNCSLLTEVNIDLPATTLTDYCYSYMFYKCSFREFSSELPATVMKSYCYNNMLSNNTAFTTFNSALPAMTLAPYCYNFMFGNNTAFTTFNSALPATNLVERCYGNFFYNCSSLSVIPFELPATVMAPTCYNRMFEGTAITTVPKLIATTLADECYRYMFQNCTSLYISDEPVSGTAEQAWTIPQSGVFENTYTFTDVFNGCLGTRASNNMEAVQGESLTYYTQSAPV